MPKRKRLDVAEQAAIKTWKDAGKKQNWVAKRIGRSECVVSTFLNDPDNYGKRSYAIKRRKVSDRGISRLVREAEKGELGSQALVRDLDLGISGRHARRLLVDVGGLNFGPLKRTIVLTPGHTRRKGVRFSKEWQQKINELLACIFTDYTKFTLDGPLTFRNGCWRRPGAPLLKAHMNFTRGQSAWKKGLYDLGRNFFDG
jgi:hypothetical protein